MVEAPNCEYITSLAQFEELKGDTSKPLIIDFTATWCPPCKMIGPKFNAIAQEMADAMTFRKCDVDAAAEVAQAVGIQCMPTFKVFKNGAEVGKLEGASEQGIKDLVNQHK